MEIRERGDLACRGGAPSPPCVWNRDVRHDAQGGHGGPPLQKGCYATLHGARMSVSSVLDRVGLSRIADLPAQYLSAGQRRRLGLARLILSARPLWLLDEPLSSLDAAGRRLTAELIGQHCDDGGIAIVATHETLGLDATRFFLGTA